jgi:hypothetical protein
MAKLYPLLFFSSAISVIFSATTADIKGNAWLSPFANQVVQNVTGLVTAKVRYAFCLGYSSSEHHLLGNNWLLDCRGEIQGRSRLKWVNGLLLS